MLLQPAGISVSKIKKIVDRFGASASEKIKSNPYILFTINGYAYLAYNYDNESFAAGRVRAFLCIREKPVRVDPYIADFELITGGPGTGKSTVLKAIFETQFRIKAKSDVLLLAPTGKAARRMSEATGRPAYTIHSGLHISEETGTGSYFSKKGNWFPFLRVNGS